MHNNYVHLPSGHLAKHRGGPGGPHGNRGHGGGRGGRDRGSPCGNTNARRSTPGPIRGEIVPNDECVAQREAREQLQQNEKNTNQQTMHK